MSRLRRPPDVAAILRVLAVNNVAYVLVGSVAVQAWGVDVSAPGDLDIVPASSPENLARLADALVSMRAESWPVTGRWFVDERGEQEWANLSPEDPQYMTRLPAPNPEDVATYDSMYSTIHGDFDIVPELAGTFQDLAPRSTVRSVSGVDGVRVASVADLLARLTVPRRAKDASRVAALREVQRLSSG